MDDLECRCRHLLTEHFEGACQVPECGCPSFVVMDRIALLEQQVKQLHERLIDLEARYERHWHAKVFDMRTPSEGPKDAVIDEAKK